MPNKVFEFFNISTLLIISVFFNINYGKDLNAPIFLMRKEEEKKKKQRGGHSHPHSAEGVANPPPSGWNEVGKLPPWPMGVAVATLFFIFTFK
jgi:hypothetical protein